MTRFVTRNGAPRSGREPGRSEPSADLAGREPDGLGRGKGSRELGWIFTSAVSLVKIK